MERRDFLKTAAVAGIGLSLWSQFPAGRAIAATVGGNGGEAPLKEPDLIGVMGGEPAAMFQRAIREFGGIGRFVSPGKKVLVKPNIGWDQPPEMGANTNPQLIGEIVAECVAAGAKEVAVFDHTCNEWRSCYRNSGIQQAVEAAGGVVYSGDDEADYVEMEIAGARKLKKAKVHRLVRDCDVFINVPVLKHHSGATMTCAMKNFMGIVWDRGFLHQHDLQQCIADSVLIRRPDLNVVDAYRVMLKNGPRGVSESDVVLAKMLLMGRDIVALDTACAKQAGFAQEKVGHLANAEALGLGTTKLEQLDIRRIQC